MLQFSCSKYIQIHSCKFPTTVTSITWLLDCLKFSDTSLSYVWSTTCSSTSVSYVLWNGLFPAVPINKDVTAVSYSDPPKVSFWAWRMPRKNNACILATMRLLPLPIVSEKLKCENSDRRMLAPDSWDAYESNDFTKPRPLHLLIHRKALNSLTWDIWFSLIYNNLLTFRLHALFLTSI